MRGLFAVTIFTTAVLGHVAAKQWTRPSGDDTLRFGTPESVGLLSAPFLVLEQNITNYQKPANYSSFYDGIHPIEPSSAVIGEFAYDSTIFEESC